VTERAGGERGEGCEVAHGDYDDISPASAIASGRTSLVETFQVQPANNTGPSVAGYSMHVHLINKCHMPLY
jgi:hypothetical protein